MNSKRNKSEAWTHFVEDTDTCFAICNVSVIYKLYNVKVKRENKINDRHGRILGDIILQLIMLCYYAF